MIMSLNLDQEILKLVAQQSAIQSTVDEIRKEQLKIRDKLELKIASYDAIINQGKGAYWASLTLAGVIGAGFMSVIKFLFPLIIK